MMIKGGWLNQRFPNSLNARIGWKYGFDCSQRSTRLRGLDGILFSWILIVYLHTQDADDDVLHVPRGFPDMRRRSAVHACSQVRFRSLNSSPCLERRSRHFLGRGIRKLSITAAALPDSHCHDLAFTLIFPVFWLSSVSGVTASVTDYRKFFLMRLLFPDEDIQAAGNETVN